MTKEKITQFFKQRTMVRHITVIAGICLLVLGYNCITNNSPDIQAKFNDFAPLSVFRYLVLVVTALVLMGCYFAGFVMKGNFLRYVIVIFLTGFMYALVMTPYSQPDTLVHAHNSEVVSNALVLRNEKLSRIGAGFAEGDGHFQTSRGYISLVKDLFRVDHSVTRETPLVDYIGYPPMNYPPAYLPQAVGITLARILWINNIWVYYAGTIMNLLFFAVISTLAITIIPRRFRCALIVLTLLPMSLHLAASYSYDTFVNALSFLFIAYLLKLRSGNNQIGTKQIIALVLIVTLLAPAKFFYGFLGFCVFILPQNRFASKRQYWITVVAAVVLPLVLTVIFKLPQAKDIALSNGSHPEIGRETYTTGYIFENPLETLKIFIRTTFVRVLWWIGIFAGTLLAASFNVPKYWIFLYLLLLPLSIFRSRSEEHELTIRDRMIFLAVSFFIYGVILTAEFVGWTPAGSDLVDGVQGRYFIPVALPLLCFCSNKLFTYGNKKSFAKVLTVCGVLLNTAIVNYVARITSAVL